ncbi:MAG: M43 family zinc metalloprotease [Bacteroidota bacterium]
MRKCTITSVILCLWVYCASYCQEPEPHSYCAHAQLVQQIQKNYPDYSQHSEAFYQKALQSSQRNSYLRNELETYIIPVVVHVLWQNSEENISEERIRQQIQVLNEDFQQNNVDTINLRPEFSGVAGNAMIAFELIDIIRVKTDTSFSFNFNWTTFEFDYPDHVKQSARGGSDPRDVNTYLNIWVCPIQSDRFLGYAYPPDGLEGWPEVFQAPDPNFDGVVINYKAFGRWLDPFIDDMGNEFTLKGRVATHEVGHYLGLRHPWGDPSIDTPGCQVDDGLADTPNAARSSIFTCDPTQNTCEEGRDNLPDMIENFMDHSPDDCKHLFTTEQVALMRYVLRNHRSLLRIKNIPIEKKEEVLVYPNPSSGFVNVFVNPKVDLTYDITIRSPSESKVLAPIQSNLYNQNDNYRFDLREEPPGLYLIEFATNGRRVFTKRVVIVR